MKLWVALPDTLTIDSHHLRDKTLKIGQIARAAALFGVSKIFIYKEGEGHEDEFRQIKLILEYLETPQYLRKKIFPYMKMLKYAGILPPLKIPHHLPKVPLTEIKLGEYREGIISETKGQVLADLGLSSPIPVDSKGKKGERITVRFTSVFPNVRVRQVRKEEIKQYWGYEVERSLSLSNLIKNNKDTLVIFTSKKGKIIKKVWKELIKLQERYKNLMLIFGSPKRGIFEILSDEGLDPFRLSKYTLNIIPNQKVDTIRIEEAFLASLAVLNIIFLDDNKIV